MSKKTGRLSVRFTPEDMEAIDDISRKEEMWASSWVRKAALEALTYKGEKKDGSLQIRNHIRWRPKYEDE